MVVKQTERDRLRESRINGKVQESLRWIQRVGVRKGWERQINKGRGEEKSILSQEYASRRIRLLEYQVSFLCLQEEVFLCFLKG